MTQETEIVRSFKLHLRCANCRRDAVKVLNVPNVEGAPQDVDDLMEDACMQNLGFMCQACGGLIAKLVAVTTGRSLREQGLCSQSA